MSLHAPTRPKPHVLLPRTLPQSARKKVEAAIEGHMAAAEALTAFLNEADGDPDDEPSLGSTGRSFNAEFVDQTSWALGSTDDREGGDVQDEPHDPDTDLEPCLAFTNDFNQERAQRHLGVLGVAGSWVNASEDLEVEHDGREDNELEQENEHADDADLEPLCPPNLSQVF